MNKCKLINKILSGKIDITLIENGGYSDVYEVEGYPNVVFKKSHTYNDGFRKLASLPLKKREYFSFRNVLEKKKNDETGEMFYLLENLKPLNLSENEKLELNELNSFDFLYHTEETIMPCESKKVGEIMSLIFKMKKAFGRKFKFAEYDFHESNFMQDEKGRLYVTDPISEYEEF